MLLILVLLHSDLVVYTCSDSFISVFNSLQFSAVTVHSIQSINQSIYSSDPNT